MDKAQPTVHGSSEVAHYVFVAVSTPEPVTLSGLLGFPS